ncbi:MAG: site-specific integrase [Ignavibacteriales bacterium]|nr:site-specific integrase [Ignavibacteriales bacterium]
MPAYSRKLSKGIHWFFKFSYNGKVYFSPCIYHSKGEAKLAESDRYKEIDEQRRNPNLKNDVLLLDLINARLDELKIKKSHKYYLGNKAHFKLLLDALGNVPISQITKSDINNFLLAYANDQHAKGFGNYAVNTMIRAFKSLFYFGIDNFNLNISNPCKGIRMFSVNKRLKYIPSDTEIEKVRSVCNKQQKLLMDFAKETGCRIGEALRFKGKDISQDYIVLYTRKSKNSDLTPRKLPKPVSLKSKYRADELVFGTWSELPKFLDKKLRELKKKDPTAKVWGWHSFRHRYASLLSKQGKPIYEIMILLGHSQISTTQRYLQLLP